MKSKNLHNIIGHQNQSILNYVTIVDFFKKLNYNKRRRIIEYCANYEIIYSSDNMMILIVENTYKEPYLILINGISKYMSLIHKDMRIANKIARIRLDKAEYFDIKNARDVIDKNKLKDLPYYNFKDFDFNVWYLNDNEKRN